MQSVCGRGCELDDPRFEFLDWLCVPYSLPVISYWPSTIGIKWPGREPINSPVSSTQVMTHNTKFPSVLRLQLNEQQKVKAVRVPGTEMYGKEWAGCNAEWYSAVGEGVLCELLTV